MKDSAPPTNTLPGTFVPAGLAVLPIDAAKKLFPEKSKQP